jgi:hypothetical protein
VLTPVNTSGPPQYHEAATHLFGIDQPGVPVAFSTNITSTQLQLARPGLATVVFSRQHFSKGV